MAISSRHKQRPGEWRDVLAPEVMERYAGKHIAIIHKKVVAVGTTFDEVRAEADKLFPNEMPYLAHIPLNGLYESDAGVNEEVEQDEAA